MIVKAWTEAEVAAMPVERAEELRSEVQASSLSASDSEGRADTFRLLRALDRRITQAPATVEQRASDARDFLYPGAASQETRQRAWDVAVHLHGSEKEAERRGHRRPEAA